MENLAEPSLQQSVAQPVNTGEENKTVAICEHVKDDGIRVRCSCSARRHDFQTQVSRHGFHSQVSGRDF